MKVLITGGAGLVGFHATKYYLERGHEVTVLDNLARSHLLMQDASEERKKFNINILQKLGARWLCESVGDPTAWMRLKDDYQLIIHLAAQTSVPTSIKNPRDDFNINAIGTFDVLEYARKVGATVVYASTNKVYPLHGGWEKGATEWRWSDDEWREHGFPLDGHIHAPEIATGSRTPYGQSKYVGDLLCQEWHHTYGVRTGIFRMSCIGDTNQFSFTEQGWLVHFIIQNLKGLPITVFGDGNQVRDVLAARDLVRAYNAFFESDMEHGIFNIGGGPTQTLSLNQAIVAIERITGMHSPVTYSGWRPLDQKVYTSDIRPLKDLFNWEPEISTNELLVDCVAWVKSNLEIF